MYGIKNNEATIVPVKKTIGISINIKIKVTNAVLIKNQISSWMSKNPKISIITVVKNNKSFIEKNILSLLSQNYKNYEHIIVDGNSTDNTIKIIRSFKKRVK